MTDLNFTCVQPDQRRNPRRLADRDARQADRGGQMLGILIVAAGCSIFWFCAGVGVGKWLS